MVKYQQPSNIYKYQIENSLGPIYEYVQTWT